MNIELTRERYQTLLMLMYCGEWGLNSYKTTMYKGEIIRSEIIDINGIEIYVTDISGHWNGQEEKTGMFRYYFDKKDASYNLLMKYPDSEIKTTKALKDNMLKSIVLE